VEGETGSGPDAGVLEPAVLSVSVRVVSPPANRDDERNVENHRRTGGEHSVGYQLVCLNKVVLACEEGPKAFRNGDARDDIDIIGRILG